MVSCCRLSQRLRSCDLGFYYSARFRCIMTTCSFGLFPSSIKPYEDRTQRMMMSSIAFSRPVSFLQAKSSSGESPVLTDCFSQKKDDRELSSEGSVSVAGGIVALGKFDALHIGHRELAIQASKAGTPFLLSFVGMAEVFGWEPRPPIVAKCDRKRVFNTWAPYCGNVAPAEFSVKFSSVRHLTPRQFVEKLSKELGVRGVVAGENYRFGYKAAGDTSELVRLCEEYEMGANIVSSVMDKTQLPGVTSSTNSKEKGQVSSTRVRHALAEGDMKYVSELLDRKHRLKMILPEQEGLLNKGSNRISAPKSCLLNLPPKDGLYVNCSLLVDDDNLLLPCKTIIDSTHIHIESEEKASWADILPRDCRVISIEFDSSEGVF